MTIRERFKEKHPRIYARILECLNVHCNDKDALVAAFSWDNTTEGWNFWNTIDNDKTEKYQIFYDKYPEEKFVLPEKWSINPRNLEEAKIIAKYFDDNKCGQKDYKYFKGNDTTVDNTYSNGGYGYGNNSGYAEITFDQFQQYVLKEPKLATQEEVTKSVEKTEFEEGDFIVVLSGRKGLDFVCNDFIYEVALNDTMLTVKKSNQGEECKAGCVKFDQSGDNWRYANEQEIAEYQRINKPYDVTTLTKTKTIEKWSVGSYVVFLKNYGYSKKGDVRRIKELNLANQIETEGEGITTKDSDFVKWFATKQEAEEFAKTLIKEVVEEKVEEKFIVGQWYKI